MSVSTEIRDEELRSIADMFVSDRRSKAFEALQDMFLKWMGERELEDIEHAIIQFSDWLTKQGYEVEAAWLLARLLFLHLSHGNIQGARAIAPKLEEYVSLSPSAKIALQQYKIRIERKETIFSPVKIERRSFLGVDIPKKEIPLALFESVEEAKEWIRKTFGEGIYEVALLEERSNVSQHITVPIGKVAEYEIIEERYEANKPE